MRRAGFVAGVLAATVVLGGCSTRAAAPNPASAAGPDSTAAAKTSLSFTGRTIDGKAFDAATLAGKPALLWFWAPWCATCASQAATVANMQDEYGDRLGVLGVAGLGSNAEMHEFVSDLEIPEVRTLDDETGAVWRQFGITQQSTYVLIDRAGSVVSSSYLDSVELPAKIATLVG